MTVETRKARKDRIDRLEVEAQIQWKAVMECEENSIGEQIEEYPVVEFRQWPNMLKDNGGSPWGEIWAYIHCQLPIHWAAAHCQLPIHWAAAHCQLATRCSGTAVSMPSSSLPAHLRARTTAQLIRKLIDGKAAVNGPAL